MKVVKLIVTLSAFSLMFSGCGIKTISTQKGDKLIVQENLPRENVETLWEGSYTDGFTTEIPKGTVLEVLLTPNAGSSIIECTVIEINGEKDPGAIEEFFVSEQIRIREGYKGCIFSIKKEYLGTKVTTL